MGEVDLARIDKADELEPARQGWGPLVQREAGLDGRDIAFVATLFKTRTF